MNHFRIGVIFLICVAFLMLSDGAVFAMGAVNSSPERLVFPTAKGQKEFENWVGLEKVSLKRLRLPEVRFPLLVQPLVYMQTLCMMTVTQVRLR